MEREERRNWCDVAIERRVRKVEAAGVAVGRRRRDGRVVDVRVYERPLKMLLVIDLDEIRSIWGVGTARGEHKRAGGGNGQAYG